jgi:glycosyltransferase involved in cell wall biosynthesis
MTVTHPIHEDNALDRNSTDGGQDRRVKVAVVAWEDYHRRAEILAQHFEASLHFVQYGRAGSLVQAPVRFPLQAWETWRILRRERPDLIVVQNPPFFAVMAVAWYARMAGAMFIIDSHTGAFIAPKWRWSVGWHRALSRRALATIVHNREQGQLVDDWGITYFVIAHTPGEYPPGTPYPFDGAFNVAIVSTGRLEKPLAEIFEAARDLPDVHFYITGSSKHFPPELLAQMPENCHLTGYLPYESYVGLLSGANAVMDLTKRDHTLVMGGFEAVSLKKPLITTDWPVLRDYFSEGTVHIPNTVEGLREGIRYAQQHEEQLQEGMARLHDRLEAEFNRDFAALQQLVEQKFEQG